MENHGYDEIIGSADAPYLNQLATQCGVAANYTSVAHPSLPNYLALTGGDTYGVTTDCTDCFQSAPNLAVDRIAASGRMARTWSHARARLRRRHRSLHAKARPIRLFEDIRLDGRAGQRRPVRPAPSMATAATTTGIRDIPNCSTLHMAPSSRATPGSRPPSAWSPTPAWTEQIRLLVIAWDEDDNAPGNQVHRAYQPVGSRRRSL